MQFVVHLDDPTVAALVDAGAADAAVARAFSAWGRGEDVAAGTAIMARAGDAPVLFETQGVAIQDIAVCGIAYEQFVACSSRPVPVIDDEPDTEDQEVTR